MKKTFTRVLSAVLAAVLCLFLLPAASLAETTLDMAFFDQALRLEGKIPADAKTASLFDNPDLSGTPVARLAAKSTVTVLSAGKKSYRVTCAEGTGYISKNKLTVSGVPAGSAPLSDQVVSSSLAVPPYIHPKDDEYIPLTGSVSLSVPVESVFFFIWDEGQGKVEQVAFWSPETPADTLDAAEWGRVLKTKGLAGGRKMLCVQTGWSPNEKRPDLTITLPEDGSAVLVQAEWMKIPEKTDVTVTDADGNILLAETLETGFWVDTVSLPAGARTVVIRPYGKKAAMASIRVYGDDYPRELVQQWQEMPEHLDILFFSAHQDDEVLFFSGMIPWYSHLGKKLGIVYMANCGRNRYQEALRSMWFSGMRIHPVFLGFMDKEIASIDVAANCWPGSQEAIVRQIRRAKPDIVVVQDLNGEYGHTQHRLTALQVTRGVEYAADPAYDPESAAQYGTWDVKKLYVHLYEENQVHMNWDIPLEECGGFTSWDLAMEAFELHYSQTKTRYFRMERQSRMYDSSLFGLYRTTVGPDTPGVNDLFENLE